MLLKFKLLIISVLICFLIVTIYISVLLFSHDSMVETKTKSIAEEVYFYHYNNEYPHNSTELKTGEELNKNINLNAPWKFFVHGWTTSPWVSPWFQLGKTAYFENGEYNIVFVDWSIPANQSYIDSVLNSVNVGHFFGDFLIHLINNNVKLSDIHLLGHSLGSHMTGFTGKYVQDRLNDRIGRITGLDPAGPFFERNPLFQNTLKKDSYQKQIFETIMASHQINGRPGLQLTDPDYSLVPENWRLSKNDADFVDIIHTDGLFYGMTNSIGHIDFFPNGGLAFQPGCENDTDSNCSHARSVYFFVESINSNNFVGKECESCEKYKEGLCQNNTEEMMGEYTNYKGRGNFYLSTNSKPPFAQG